MAGSWVGPELHSVADGLVHIIVLYETRMVTVILASCLGRNDQIGSCYAINRYITTVVLVQSEIVPGAPIPSSWLFR